MPALSETELRLLLVGFPILMLLGSWLALRARTRSRDKRQRK